MQFSGDSGFLAPACRTNEAVQISSVGKSVTQREGRTGRDLSRRSRAYDASMHASNARAAVADAVRAVAHFNPKRTATGGPPKHWRAAARAGGAVAEGWSAAWALGARQANMGGYYDTACSVYDEAGERTHHNSHGPERMPNAAASMNLNRPSRALTNPNTYRASTAPVDTVRGTAVTLPGALLPAQSPKNGSNDSMHAAKDYRATSDSALPSSATETPLPGPPPLGESGRERSAFPSACSASRSIHDRSPPTPSAGAAPFPTARDNAPPGHLVPDSYALAASRTTKPEKARHESADPGEHPIISLCCCCCPCLTPLLGAITPCSVLEHLRSENNLLVGHAAPQTIPHQHASQRDVHGPHMRHAAQTNLAVNQLDGVQGATCPRKHPGNTAQRGRLPHTGTMVIKSRNQSLYALPHQPCLACNPLKNLRGTLDASGRAICDKAQQQCPQPAAVVVVVGRKVFPTPWKLCTATWLRTRTRTRTRRHTLCWWLMAAR